MRAQGTSDSRRADLTDREVWERSQKTEVTPAEAERFLDLAGYVDRWLDEDERECVAALIARDADAASDAAAAKALRANMMLPVSDATIARAVALAEAPASGSEVLPFPVARREWRTWRGAASWSSLAAGILLASWLGFNLGSDLPGVTTVSHPYDDVSTSELLDPAPLMLREFTDGSQI
jgi:anti-sigma factor RsiW